MRRGEIWAVRGLPYASKPRPVVVVQDESAGSFDSTMAFLLASHESDDVPTRVRVSAGGSSSLRQDSWVMTDKIYSARTDELGARVGELSPAELDEISHQLAVVLGLCRS